MTSRDAIVDSFTIQGQGRGIQIEGWWFANSQNIPGSLKVNQDLFNSLFFCCDRGHRIEETGVAGDCIGLQTEAVKRNGKPHKTMVQMIFKDFILFSYYYYYFFGRVSF